MKFNLTSIENDLNPNANPNSITLTKIKGALHSEGIDLSRLSGQFSMSLKNTKVAIIDKDKQSNVSNINVITGFDSGTTYWVLSEKNDAITKLAHEHAYLDSKGAVI